MAFGYDRDAMGKRKTKWIREPTKRSINSARNSHKKQTPLKGKEAARQSIYRDSLRHAKPVGKRTSKSGKTYVETRVNRSDFAGKGAKKGRRL